MLSSLVELLRQPHRVWFMRLLVAVNTLGSIYGYYWYRRQLAASDMLFWPIIPDSPRSTTFFLIALLLILWKRKAAWFQLLAYTGVIKYGIWAVAMISHAWLIGDGHNLTDWMLWVSHLGMAAQGYVFLRWLKVDGKAVAVTAAWMFFNDIMDYLFGFHPYLFSSEQVMPAMVTAVALSIVLTAAAALVNVNLSRRPEA